MSCGEHDGQLAMELEAFYREEMQAAAYYAKLVRMAPDSDTKSILREMSTDERRHATNLQRAYVRLTGGMPERPAQNQSEIADYRKALRQRLVPETEDYRTYGKKGMETECLWLREMFCKMAMDENVHAIRLHALLMQEQTE